MLSIIILSVVAAFLAPLGYKILGRLLGYVFALLPLTAFVYLISLAPSVKELSAVTQSVSWIPSLGINLSFYLDGLSLVFALLISGIGTLVFVYAAGYLGKHPKLGLFYMYLTLFMSSMLGLVLSNNILSMFVFWELTSVSSFFLIGFEHEREAARQSAMKALLITGSGGLLLLAGLLLLGASAGQWEWTAVLQESAQLNRLGLILPMFGLIVLGAATKSAQVPFHFWLPGAMEAPTPVSAYLHSATMVKAGVYLLARVFPLFSHLLSWTWVLMGLGLLTTLVGAYQSYLQHDLKKILAYSTVSVLGSLVALLGMGSDAALQAAVVFTMAHGLSKAALFMLAGILAHSNDGERDVRKFAGFKQLMPGVAVIALLAVASKIGLVPFLGFIGKELVYTASLGAWGSHFVVIILVASNMLLMASIVRVGLKPFWGVLAHPPKHFHKPEFSLVVGPLILAVLGLVWGLFPGILEYHLFERAWNAIQLSGPAHWEHLALWHGWNKPLLLSGITLLGGSFLLLKGDKLRPVMNYLALPTGSAWYEGGLKALQKMSVGLTGWFQNGYQRCYIRVIIIAAIGLVGWVVALALQGESAASGQCLFSGGICPFSSGAHLFKELWRLVIQKSLELSICLVILGAALASLWARSILSAVMVLGFVGYGLALLFVVYGAPDLALTQMLIETLSLLLFLFFLPKLSDIANLASKRTRCIDLLIASVVGVLMGVLSWVVSSTAAPRELTEFFAKYSYLKAHGHNVVNVIIVDFRGFDTLGEITVLTIAGLGVYSLLKLNWRKKSS